MSVLKSKRNESKAEYVNTANAIFTHTVAFVIRMPARPKQILAPDVIRLASEVLDNVVEANDIFPSDDLRKDMRKRHLLEARASLKALDVHLAHCYNILRESPGGLSEAESASKWSAAKVKARLDKMSQTLGELIDKENGMLTRLIEGNKDTPKVS